MITKIPYYFPLKKELIKLGNDNVSLQLIEKLIESADSNYKEYLKLFFSDLKNILTKDDLNKVFEKELKEYKKIQKKYKDLKEEFFKRITYFFVYVKFLFLKNIFDENKEIKKKIHSHQALYYYFYSSIFINLSILYFIENLPDEMIIPSTGEEFVLSRIVYSSLFLGLNLIVNNKHFPEFYKIYNVLNNIKLLCETKLPGDTKVKVITSTEEILKYTEDYFSELI